ncbi:MAG TPA: chemotaxis protein CheX [Candidatus Acidoferrum sp.]|nr:chemotaxis protein CheX [Candidatus Acidoferrum sp.]
MKSANDFLAVSNEHSDWIPLLELSAREVFELMLGCHLKPLQAVPETNLDITAMVGLAGQLCGVLSIRSSKDAAGLMAFKMLGAAADNDSQEVRDAFGEICNMVAGNFKNKVSGMAEGCMLSVPTVVTGNDYSLHSLADSPPLEVNLQFENHDLVISLEIS